MAKAKGPKRLNANGFLAMGLFVRMMYCAVAFAAGPVPCEYEATRGPRQEGNSPTF